MAATVLPVEDERKLRDLVRSYLERAGSSLLTGLVVARRITRPVERLIAVTRAMGRRERTARVGPISAPGEIGELATLAAADAAALPLA